MRLFSKFVLMLCVANSEVCEDTGVDGNCVNDTVTITCEDKVGDVRIGDDRVNKVNIDDNGNGSETESERHGGHCTSTSTSTLPSHSNFADQQFNSAKTKDIMMGLLPLFFI